MFTDISTATSESQFIVTKAVCLTQATAIMSFNVVTVQTIYNNVLAHVRIALCSSFIA